MASSVKLSSKHQIVVPREAREALGLKPGSRLLIVVKPGGVVEMQLEPSDVTAEMEGLLIEGGAGGRLWEELRDE